MAGSRSTRMSMSLSGRCSPRAAEPNKAACMTPCARKSASRSFSLLMISSRCMGLLYHKSHPVSTAKTGSYCVTLITKLESPAPGPRSTVILKARGADVRVTKPFLHLGDVRLVVERIGGGGRPQRMGADFEPERS